MGIKKNPLNKKEKSLGLSQKPLKNKKDKKINVPDNCKEAIVDSVKNTSKKQESNKSAVSYQNPATLLEEVRKRLREDNDRTIIMYPVSKAVTYKKILRQFPSCVNFRMINVENKKSKGRVFIQFLNKTDAETSINDENQKAFGEKVKILSCSQRQKNTSGYSWLSPNDRFLCEFNFKHLYVTGLPKLFTHYELSQLFPKAAKIEIKQAKRGDEMVNFGMCHMYYNDAKDAFEDFKTKHHTIAKGCPLSINFGLGKHLKPKKDYTDKFVGELSEILPKADLRKFVELELQGLASRKDSFKSEKGETMKKETPAKSLKRAKRLSESGKKKMHKS